MPFEPASSGLFGEGLYSLLERSDKIAEEKRQKALRGAVVCIVKPGKGLGQHEAKHNAQKGGGPKEDQGRKKKHAKKGSDLQAS